MSQGATGPTSCQSPVDWWGESRLLAFDQPMWLEEAGWLSRWSRSRSPPRSSLACSCCRSLVGAWGAAIWPEIPRAPGRAWGRWKADLVHELTRRVDHYLAGGDLAALVTQEFPDAAQRDLLAAGETVVEAGGDVITVVAPDRPGLFSRVAGSLALHGLEVRAADAAGQDGMAIEVFQVASRLAPSVDWDRVRTNVRAGIEGRLAIEARLAERVRTYSRRATAPSPPPPSVRFDDAASRTATVVEVQAPDHIGLLYRVLRAFAEFDLDVRVAKIQTLGDLVVDAFYVTTADGALVEDPEVRRELERALLHAVT